MAETGRQTEIQRDRQTDRQTQPVRRVENALTEYAKFSMLSATPPYHLPAPLYHKMPGLCYCKNLRQLKQKTNCDFRQ